MAVKKGIGRSNQPDPKADEKRLLKFIEGKITQAELQGISKKSLEKIAKIGFDALQQGKFDDADVVFRGLVALDPYEPYFLSALGALALRRDNLEEAEAWYSRSIEAAQAKRQKAPIARANRGEVRLMQERLEDAIDDLATAIEEDPQFQQPTTERARALLAEVSRQMEAQADSLPLDTAEEGSAALPNDET